MARKKAVKVEAAPEATEEVVLSLTRAQIVSIQNCSGNKWNQIRVVLGIENPRPEDAAPPESSGTSALSTYTEEESNEGE